MTELNQDDKLDLSTLSKTDTGKYILKLESPISFGQEVVTELEMSEPKVKHLRMLSSKPTMNEMIQMAGKMAARSDSFMDELSFKDMNLISSFIGAFS